MTLVNVNKLGISKGTALEEAVTADFRGETQDLFDESSRDEARHAMMPKGLIERFFK